MIREDYILSWIRRYVGWLLELLGFIKTQDHQAAIARVDMILRTLLEVGSDSVTSLSEGEILARLALGDPPQLVQEKCVVLAVVLQNLGVITAARQETESSRASLLMALHIVLGLKLRGESNALLEYVPGIEQLVEQLKPHSMPARTHAALMIYFEQQGQFAKAEDALFDLLEGSSESDRTDSLEMGFGLYQRLRVLSDAALAEGGLPRAEVEAGLAELSARRSSPPVSAQRQSS